MPLELDYYYGNEAEQYSFYRIPKVLFTDSRFRGVSVEAKVLYGLLLDRMSLSVKNGWLDGDGRVYIIYTIADVMETLVCAEQKANKLLSELDAAKGVGLIERRRRGLGKPNVIYVKNFIIKPQVPPRNPDAPEPPKLPGLPKQTVSGELSVEVRPAASSKQPVPLGQSAWPDPPAGPALSGRKLVSAETGMPPDMHGQSGNPESQIQNCENHKSGNVKIANLELRKSQTNNTDLNNTEMSETDPSINPHMPENPGEGTGQMDKMGLYSAYCALIRENISYSILLERHPHDRERLDGFVELIAEICSSTRKTVRVNQEDMCTEVVKSRFLKLDSSHIEYVMDCLDKNTALVGNIRAYTLSTLFNAPVTISQYYSSLVSHDMAHGFGGG